LQNDTNRYAEAEANYTEALGIYRKYVETNPDAYLWYAANTLEGLIEVKEKLCKNDEAEELKKELEEIKTRQENHD